MPKKPFSALRVSATQDIPGHINLQFVHGALYLWGQGQRRGYVKQTGSDANLDLRCQDGHRKTTCLSCVVELKEVGLGSGLLPPEASPQT